MTLRISVKNKWGGYQTFSREFESESHFEKWWYLQESLGHKIIGYLYKTN